MDHIILMQLLNISKNFNESTKRTTADAGFIFEARHSYLEK